jgi:TRAP-type transport system periplasmic protein
MNHLLGGKIMKKFAPEKATSYQQPPVLWKATMRLARRVFAIFSLACVMTATVSPWVAFAQGTDIQERRLKFAMSVGVTSPWTQAAQQFAAKLENASGGKIKTTVFPDGQLSNGNQIAEFDLLKNGSVDFTFHSSIILSSVDPRFALFSMPWIAPSEQALYALMDGEGQKVWAGLDKVGVVPLGGYSTTGFRQLTNNRLEVTKPEDLKGLTLRVPGLKLYQSIFRELGVNPVVTSFGELYGALQTGVVNGQENPLNLTYSSKLYETQKFLTLWNYSGDSIGILTNRKLWDSASAKERELMTTAAREAAIWHRGAQVETDKQFLAEIAKRLKVTVLTPEQITVFRKAMEPVYREWEPIIGTDLIKSAGGR